MKKSVFDHFPLFFLPTLFKFIALILSNIAHGSFRNWQGFNITAAGQHVRKFSVFPILFSGNLLMTVNMLSKCFFNAGTSKVLNENYWLSRWQAESVLWKPPGHTIIQWLNDQIINLMVKALTWMLLAKQAFNASTVK